MRWLNYHHLYYFRSIANEGGIAKAAKKLRLGQPALSAQLKQLEESLDVELFDRSNRRLQLTKVGRIVLDYANEIFQLGEELVDVVENNIATGLSILNIGSIECIPKSLIEQLISATKTHTDCLVRVYEGTTNYLTQELLEHRLDLFLSDHPPPVGGAQSIYSRMVGSAPIAIFGAKTFQKIKHKKFPQSLEGCSFILPTKDSKFRHDLDYFFRTRKIGIKVVAETQDTSVQTLLGFRGLGLIPLPDFASLQAVKDRRLFRIGSLPKVKQDFWIIASHRKIDNPIAAHLMETFKVAM